MNSKPHGIAVIISIDEIMMSPGSVGLLPPSRRAVNVDKVSLAETFKYLGYSVEMYSNLTISELKHRMRQ